MIIVSGGLGCGVVCVCVGGGGGGVVKDVVLAHNRYL